MKKVIMFHTEFFFSGGAEHTLLETIDALQTQGFDVTCYAPYVNKQTCFPDIITKYPIYSLLPAGIFRIKLPRELYVIIAAFLSPLLMRKFRNGDIYYGANQAGPFFAYIASIVNKKPYIVYMPYPQGFLYPRKIDSEFGEQSDITLTVKILIKIIKPIFRRIDFLIMQNARHIITEGTYAQKIFEKIYKRKCINCPPGANPLSINELKNRDHTKGELQVNDIIVKKPYILLTNRHMPKKKFEYAIEIMRIIKSKHPNFQYNLIITGSSTEYTKQLIHLIQKNKLNKLIIFTEYTSEIDTQLLYKNAAVYIYPAPEEDFGKGIIQAMACGVPVIAWDSAGPSGIIKDNHTGFAIAPFKLDQFAEKTYNLVNDPTINYKMGVVARNDVAENFSTLKHNKIIMEALS